MVSRHEDVYCQRLHSYLGGCLSVCGFRLDTHVVRILCRQSNDSVLVCNYLTLIYVAFSYLSYAGTCVWSLTSIPCIYFGYIWARWSEWLDQPYPS